MHSAQMVACIADSGRHKTPRASLSTTAHTDPTALRKLFDIGVSGIIINKRVNVSHGGRIDGTPPLLFERLLQ